MSNGLRLRWCVMRGLLKQKCFYYKVELKVPFDDSNDVTDTEKQFKNK